MNAERVGILRFGNVDRSRIFQNDVFALGVFYEISFVKRGIRSGYGVAFKVGVKDISERITAVRIEEVVSYVTVALIVTTVVVVTCRRLEVNLHGKAGGKIVHFHKLNVVRAGKHYRAVTSLHSTLARMSVAVGKFISYNVERIKFSAAYGDKFGRAVFVFKIGFLYGKSSVDVTPFGFRYDFVAL